MKKLVFVFIIVIGAFFSTKAQAGNSPYKKNLEVAKYLYDKGVQNTILQRESLTEDDRLALSLAVFYQYSVEEMSVSQMKIVLEKYYNIDLSGHSESEIETLFLKYIKQIDDLINTKPLEYLKTEF